jgi:hypothetical protein
MCCIPCLTPSPLLPHHCDTHGWPIDAVHVTCSVCMQQINKDSSQHTVLNALVARVSKQQEILCCSRTCVMTISIRLSDSQAPNCWLQRKTTTVTSLITRYARATSIATQAAQICQYCSLLTLVQSESVAVQASTNSNSISPVSCYRVLSLWKPYSDMQW